MIRYKTIKPAALVGTAMTGSARLVSKNIIKRPSSAAKRQAEIAERHEM